MTLQGHNTEVDSVIFDSQEAVSDKGMKYNPVNTLSPTPTPYSSHLLLSFVL